MDALKRIGLVSNGLGGWRLWSKDEPGMGGRDHPDAEYILLSEHDRIVAEKDAEIAMLRAERDRWHADANLMLGFADLAYDVGACPTSSELIAARDRVVATISNAAFEDAARAAERDCDWTAFGKAGIEEWDGGPDGVRDYRLGIRAGRAIAAAIRAMKGE